MTETQRQHLIELWADESRRKKLGRKMKKIWKDEKKRKRQRRLMKKYWDNEELREEQRQKLYRYYEENGTKSGITIHQKEDQTGYNYEYQKLYRERRPGYYNWLRHKRKGYIGKKVSYEEWYAIYSKNPRYYKEK